jgi:putative transposase
MRSTGPAAHSTMQEFGRRLHHVTPGWVKSGAAFHVRIRVDESQAKSLVEPSIGFRLLDAVRRYHELGRWWCDLFLLMLDHAHAIVVFPVEPGMSMTMRDWKRGVTRLQEVAWQENYFDHRIRDDAEFAETWHYIRRNPVAKGLCAHEDDWPWWWAPGGAR